jgi:hypothetical protein
MQDCLNPVWTALTRSSRLCRSTNLDEHLGVVVLGCVAVGY